MASDVKYPSLPPRLYLHSTIDDELGFFDYHDPGNYIRSYGYILIVLDEVMTVLKVFLPEMGILAQKFRFLQK